MGNGNGTPPDHLIEHRGFADDQSNQPPPEVSQAVDELSVAVDKLSTVVAAGWKVQKTQCKRLDRWGEK